MQVHHHIRHTFREKQVFPKSSPPHCRYARHGMPAKFALEPHRFQSPPPPQPGFRLTAQVRPDFCPATILHRAGCVLLVVHGGERRHVLRRAKKADPHSLRGRNRLFPTRGRKQVAALWFLFPEAFWRNT